MSQGATGGMEQISLEVHTSSLFVVFFFLIFKDKSYLFKKFKNYLNWSMTASGLQRVGKQLLEPAQTHVQRVNAIQLSYL